MPVIEFDLPTLAPNTGSIGPHLPLGPQLNLLVLLPTLLPPQWPHGPQAPTVSA